MTRASRAVDPRSHRRANASETINHFFFREIINVLQDVAAVPSRNQELISRSLLRCKKHLAPVTAHVIGNLKSWINLL